MVFVGGVIEVGETAHTVIWVVGQDLGHFGNVLLADIALNLVGRVHDVLKFTKKYVKIEFIETGSVLGGLDLGSGLAGDLLVVLDEEFPGNEKKGT